MPYSAADESLHVIDSNSLEEEPLAVHVREEHELEAEYFRAHERKVVSAEKSAENQLLAEHAKQVAGLQSESRFWFQKHSFLSLKAPVVAKEDESALARAYISKGPRGRSLQVRAEVELECKRLRIHSMNALKRKSELENELKELDEQEQLHAASEAVFLAQLKTNKELEAFVKQKRLAANAAIVIPPLGGRLQSQPPPKQPNKDDEQLADVQRLLDDKDMD